MSENAETTPAAGSFLEGTWLRILAPTLLALLFLGGWEMMVRVREIPPYILPGPLAIWQTLLRDWGSLSVSLLITLKITFMALSVAAILGLVLAILFAQSRIIELSLFPFAVILQVTPIVAIAPLIIIWVDDIAISLLICAWIVAFFPILSNTVIGLKSADSNLRDLYQLYGASPWQRFRLLLVPSALPYFLGGLKIAGGLSLIGAVVAEFTAGAAGRNTGLASRILESSFRTEIPMMFAALLLVSLLGIVIFIVFAALAKLLLGHWHESELRREV
ncbi:MAG: ABC transporter permease [Alphaproteobacteria bacterium]